jgi:FMN phosphatase YigB (HAD superfamily)
MGDNYSVEIVNMDEKLVLWDLDRCLCPHNAAFHQQAPQAVAYAAMDFVESLTWEEAIASSKANYSGQKRAVQYFADRYNLDVNQVYQRYYHHLQTDFIKPNIDFIEMVQCSLQHFTHGVFTQAPRLWIDKALTKLGLASRFDADWLLGAERLPYGSKGSDLNIALLRKTFDLAQMRPRQIILVDDRLHNLQQVGRCIGTKILVDADPSALLDNTVICVRSAQEAMMHVLESEGEGQYEFRA